MAKNKTYRFCFGSPKKPLTPIWRVVVSRKKGDVMLMPHKELGNDFHISFHVSGQCHFRDPSGERTNLSPPRLIQDRFIAFRFFFRKLNNPLPPIVEESPRKLSEIKWIEAPAPDMKTVVEFSYRLPGQKLHMPHHAKIHYSDIPAVMFKKSMLFAVASAQEKLTPKEKLDLAITGPLKLGLPKDYPGKAYFTRISRTPEDGVGALLYEEFSLGHS
ncbi:MULTISPECIES: hypothetical protein [unclassified Ruegeria]|uniref:hypothetical protein n=1 Tax=unclassified Ruegeria TaxID=2625375 RepID=UPI0014909AAC|nr:MULTISPECIES: hypothetical protein [unclassified Ruegeria]NOD88375.1 hypothetical protein [Ruegeria sp. HKCCD4318]NOE13284.1 hypothetical protein [Ruegeria sp. HKCCD4318-2]NOG11174.1 hypothetical protein [Ruegeria sp. HKCCD4315]